MQIFASPETQAERRQLCNACEHKSKLSVCMKCGCVIPAKIRLALSSCPIGKWQREDTNKET